jgi:hypothetical protein
MFVETPHPTTTGVNGYLLDVLFSLSFLCRNPKYYSVVRIPDKECLLAQPLRTQTWHDYTS